jgi:hypothetical protein
MRSRKLMRKIHLIESSKIIHNIIGRIINMVEMSMNRSRELMKQIFLLRLTLKFQLILVINMKKER